MVTVYKKNKKSAKDFFDSEVAPLINGSTSDQLIDKFGRTSKRFFYDLPCRKNMKERQFASMVGLKDEFFVDTLIKRIIEEHHWENKFYCKKVTANEKSGIGGRLIRFAKRSELLKFGGDCVIYKKSPEKPILVIECKEYIDMTRLKELIGESRVIKSRIKKSKLIYPRLQFWVYAEVLELTPGWRDFLEKSDLKYKIDRVFIARDGKRADYDSIPNKERLHEFKNAIEDFLERNLK